jgi:HAD superfamily hydrolase (TIGR01459 family)
MTVIPSLAAVADRYDALFVDLWGCVHDGVRAVPGANEALRAFREGGGRVVLVTNSPRPRAGVEQQLALFGVDPEAWDAIATSGDSARVATYRGVVGSKVWHIGYAGEGDGGFFTPPGILEAPLSIEAVPLDEAEGIVCTGPFDAQADPEVLLPELERARDRGLKLLCANPDIVVDRGAVREWCAGAVARLYTRIGGESLYFGKPHKPIYDLARRRLALLAEVPDARILAIGDGPGTDGAGAAGEGLDFLFITGGLAALETGTPRLGDPDPDRLSEFLETMDPRPTYCIGSLR